MNLKSFKAKKVGKFILKNKIKMINKMYVK